MNPPSVSDDVHSDPESGSQDGVSSEDSDISSSDEAEFERLCSEALTPNHRPDIETVSGSSVTSTLERTRGEEAIWCGTANKGK